MKRRFRIASEFKKLERPSAAVERLLAGCSAPAPRVTFSCSPKRKSPKRRAPRSARHPPRLAVFGPQARATVLPCTAREAPLPAAPLRGLPAENGKARACPTGVKLKGTALTARCLGLGLSSTLWRARDSAPHAGEPAGAPPGAARRTQYTDVLSYDLWSARRRVAGAFAPSGGALSLRRILWASKESDPGLRGGAPALNQARPEGGRTFAFGRGGSTAQS